jgi:hypothetical protein
VGRSGEDGDAGRGHPDDGEQATSVGESRHRGRMWGW